jgi:hypothetical protein
MRPQIVASVSAVQPLPVGIINHGTQPVQTIE